MTDTYHRNEGARLMAGKPVRAIARALKVNASTVSRWASGDRQPEPVHAAKLEKLYGIPKGAWGQTAKAEPTPAPPTQNAASVALSTVCEALEMLVVVPGVVEAAVAGLGQLAVDLEDDPDAAVLAAAVEAARAELADAPVPSWPSVVLIGLVAIGAPGAAGAVARALVAIERGGQ